MRMGSLFVAIVTLLAIGTSTSVPAADPDWPKSLTLVTSSPGGPFYIYGEALANILTEKLGISVNPLPTQGTVQNVKLLDSGTAQLGLIVMGGGLQGWNGTGDWTNGKKFRNMRALFPLYDAPLEAVVLQRSGITTFAQLDKKRIGVGPKGNALETYILPILKTRSCRSIPARSATTKKSASAFRNHSFLRIDWRVARGARRPT